MIAGEKEKGVQVVNILVARNADEEYTLVIVPDLTTFEEEYRKTAQVPVDIEKPER